ncbi:nucleotide exchange factor GrpE [Sabulicella glaciei]|uniref:Protein GrpE n=1 Tax=Sabulicella glaciei TaxID=2984948 RepID=A0ABT3NUR4_9PROT|nr:nucleotide exchange factor GrpE [Roseococcus sp. MDT2-1-1]MCW8085904.1 nucleotide exchange factor GrpE [Roseococcus sp. MDT2-1-1]
MSDTPDQQPAPEAVNDAAAPEARPDPTPEEHIAALEAKVAELESALLYARAETANAVRRGREEADKARLFAVQKFAADVVEAAENLRRGLESLPPAAEDEPELLAKLRGGFEGVERFMLGRLEANGIQRKPAQGEKFDPELHQAMSEAPAPDGVEPGTVLQAWSSAWTLNGRLLKPAMVVVAAKA